MKSILLSLIFLLTVLCLVHTKSCKEKCIGKANPRACKKRCQSAKTGETPANQVSCKKRCKGESKPKACLRKCKAKQGK